MFWTEAPGASINVAGNPQIKEAAVYETIHGAVINTPTESINLVRRTGSRRLKTSVPPSEVNLMRASA